MEQEHARLAACASYVGFGRVASCRASSSSCRDRAFAAVCLRLLGIMPHFQPLQLRPCLCRRLLAAPAVVQPASGSDPARLPFASIEPVIGPHPMWLHRWIMFEYALSKEAQLWESVKIEKEEQEPMVNSKPKAEHVTKLAALARLQGLEEENLMLWIFEFGEEEGLLRAIDELHDRLNFETESVASEVPWKGEVLQVHQKVSPQPTKKEEVRFLFRGSGSDLGMQRVHGGSSLMEWYLGLQGKAWRRIWEATSPPLVGRIWTL